HTHTHTELQQKQQQQQQPHALVWDLDTTLPFPCEGTQYAKEALRASTLLLPPDFARLYRVVPASLYLEHFCSDRSHMKTSRASLGSDSHSTEGVSESGGCCDDKADGASWSSPPPPWPPIQPKNSCGVLQHNLPCYWSLSPSLCCSTEALQQTLQGHIRSGVGCMLPHQGEQPNGQSEQKGPADDQDYHQGTHVGHPGHWHLEPQDSRYGLVVSEADFLRHVLGLR
ncbi:N-terminal glutamine amidase-domain-containing protein, partial [Dunaliella salina]